MTTLNDLLLELKKFHPTNKVTLDGKGDIGFESWRGVYTSASIVSESNTIIGRELRKVELGPLSSYHEAHSSDTYDGANTVGELIAVLEKVAAGGSLQGYKGGWYSMGPFSKLYADEYGTCPGALVTSVTIKDLVVTINTTKPLG